MRRVTPINAPRWLASYLWNATGEVMVCVPVTDEFVTRCLNGECLHRFETGCQRRIEERQVYHPGDIVPVREPWWHRGSDGFVWYFDGSMHTHPDALIGSRYIQTAKPPTDDWPNNYRDFGMTEYPARTMPLYAVRQHLVVSSISCGPVAEITEEQAVMCGFDGRYCINTSGNKGNEYGIPVETQFLKQWHADHPTRPEWQWRITGTVTMKH